MKYYWNYIDTFRSNSTYQNFKFGILSVSIYPRLNERLFSGLISGLITRNQTQMFSMWQYTIFIELEREKWIYLINIGIKMNIIIKLK